MAPHGLVLSKGPCGPMVVNFIFVRNAGVWFWSESSDPNPDASVGTEPAPTEASE